MSADAARLLVSRQRVRNRVLIVVAVAAAMLDAALIVLLVAAISRAVAGVAVSLVLIAVVVTVSAVDAARSAGRVRGGSPDAAQTARLGPIVTRLAEGLGVEVPALWIADDDAVNAFSAYSGRRATIFYTRGFLEEFGTRGDDALVEAVTAHLLARVASGDNGVTVTPGGVTATAAGQFTMQVTWAESSPQVTGFNIDNGCPVGSCGPGAMLAQTTGAVTTADFSVTPGSYQCFRVQAFNASGASGWSGYGCTSTPGLVLTGAPSWTDTRVDVTAGIELGLSASGTMTVDGGRQVDPSGDQACVPQATYPGANPPFVAPALHCWALIARIGNGPPFEIGATFTGIIGQTGRLYLGINGDSLTTYPGTWTVKIKKGGAA